MNLLWATRGHDWGFRFLRDGGHADPLVAYERAFAGVEDAERCWRRQGAEVAVRFPDPEGRTDHAGRVILHEFVLDGSFAAEVSSVEDGFRLLWPLVADEYAQVWAGGGPPPSPRST